MPDQEMIDRVAKALNPRAFEVFDANAIGSKDRGLAMVQIAAAKTDAIAAIKAMREPTEKMADAGLLNYLDCERNKLPWNGKVLFKVMIGAILD